MATSSVVAMYYTKYQKLLQLNTRVIPERTEIRQASYFQGRTEKAKDSCIKKMRRKIDSAIGRAMYAMRLAIAELSFTLICRITGLDRFTLRKDKDDSQWNQLCIVHNLKRSNGMEKELRRSRNWAKNSPE